LGEIRDTIARKSKFKDQLRAKLKKFKIKDLFKKGIQIQELISAKNKGEIKEF
jgi:hypothetical protein